MAEDVVDHAEMVAGVESRRCNTETLQIHGWTRAEIREKNLRAYGSDAVNVIAVMQEDPAHSSLLHPALPVQRGEVIWQARQEMARTVEDVLARRTRALLLNAKASLEAAPLVAQLLARELKRSAPWEAAQVKDFTTLARGYIFTDPLSHGSRHNSSARDS
jgi:glycerol-3-phosphate dehydrogenase